MSALVSLHWFGARLAQSQEQQPQANTEQQDAPTASDSPLVSVGENMQISRILISQGLINENAKSIQRQIVAQLEALIDQMQKPGKPGEGEPKPGSQPGDGPGQGGPKPGAGQGGQTAAADSNPSAPGANETPEQRLPTDVDAQNVARRIWGHLPPREREQMIQNMPEEFLPKYDLEIRKYYQRLAEEPSYIGP